MANLSLWRPLPPAAAGTGTGDLRYALAPIPPGLTFTTATRTLTGTPTMVFDPDTLTYTVTDSSEPTPATAALTFMVRVDATVPSAPTEVSAVAGDTVTIAVSWIAVLDADNGGSDITTYTATATGARH